MGSPPMRRATSCGRPSRYHPDFAPLFAPGSLAEVPIVGVVGGRALSGQIDRLVVAEDRVLIVDFKTLRAPPATPDEVPSIYLSQLAGYRAALARIYPDRAILRPLMDAGPAADADRRRMPCRPMNQCIFR
jgi:ATP-dependent helicase/nuclease subunit A